VLACIGVVDVKVDELETESSIRWRHVASGKTRRVLVVVVVLAEIVGLR
jgi:hypothetical protein